MRRWLIRLAVLGAGAGVSAASAPTLSAWVDTTSNPPGTLSAIPDWVAPTVDRFVAQKTQGGVAGYVRPGGTYHVCAKVAADTGNPASGLRDVVTNVGSLTSGLLSGTMNLPGPGSPCATTDNRDSGSLTVASGTTAGTKSISLQVRDNALNTRTEPASVVVDGTVPTALTFTAANKTGGTAGRPEAGDVLTLTFSEPIDPHAVIPGWDGTGTQPIYPYIVDSGNKGIDRLHFYRAGSVLTPLASSTGISLGEDDYVSANLYFTSTIAVSGDSFVITLGTPSNAAGITTDTGTRAGSWPTSASLYDRAGNPVTVATVPQAAGVKF